MNQNKKGDNEFIETVVFERCWHVKIPSKGYATQCEKCGTRIEQSHQTGFDRNPCYNSPTSPRSLLTEAEAKTIEKFGPAAYRDALAYEIFGANLELTASSQTALITAAPDIRCKAIRSIWEGEKE